MARALALETSGPVGSVALVDNGVVLCEEGFPHGLKHAAGIVPIIDRLCRGEGWAPRDIAEIYVSAGPGSFTGLRVGITVGKTLAFATGARVVAVPTTEVLALNAPTGWKNVVIVLDAKRDQVFTATFANDGTARPFVREGAHLDNLASVLARTDRPVHLIGEGIPYHQKFIPTYGSGVVVTPPELWRARAGAVAQIGHAMAECGQWTDPDRLVPIYVRKPEAEEKYDEKYGAGGTTGSHP